MAFVCPLVSRNVPLEGEGYAFPLPRSLRSLPPLLGLCPATNGAIPLGTPAALLLQISKLAPVEKPCPLSRPRTSSPTPFASINHRNLRLPSKNASGRLNLRGRFSIPKLSIT